jgi:Na+/H+-dicarboxylate symporter
MRRGFTLFLVVAILLGLAVGAAAHALARDAAETKALADLFGLLTTIFLRLIKMIIAPLVAATLICGIAHLRDLSTIGRMGLRALGWFLTASFVSLGLGMSLVLALKPGAALSIALPAASLGSAGAAGLSLGGFVEHLIPVSIFAALADNEILQIVIFSVLASIALARIGERGQPILGLAQATMDLMLKVTDYVMWLAPVGVFGAIAGAVTTHGLGVLRTYAALIGEFYLGLGLLFAAMLAVGALTLGRRGLELLRAIRQPALIAFSTASSEAAYPRLVECLLRFGVPSQISGFILPLGYSFNPAGTMMYCAFASIFIAQAYRIALAPAELLTLMAVLLITSKGIAAVPRASILVLTATLPLFHIPVEGILLLMAVDQFMDMGRTGINLIGNALATAVIAQWEGALDAPSPAAAAS